MFWHFPVLLQIAGWGCKTLAFLVLQDEEEEGRLANTAQALFPNFVSGSTAGPEQCYLQVISLYFLFFLKELTAKLFSEAGWGFCESGTKDLHVMLHCC